MCVCVSVRDGSGMFMGGDQTSDAQPQFTEPRTLRRMHWAWVGKQQSKQSDAIGEQQLKRTQSGSSS